MIRAEQFQSFVQKSGLFEAIADGSALRFCSRTDWADYQPESSMIGVIC